MKRSMRQLTWQWVFLGALLVGGGATPALAQNVFPSSGNVGIGTTSPQNALHVAGNVEVGSHVAMPTDGRIRFGDASQSWIGYLGASARGREMLHIGGFGFRRMVGLFDDVYVDGNIGIGTISPVTKLHVAGDVRVDGNLAAKYQDIAEWVKAPRLLSHGTVVVVNSQEINQILPASQSYDTRVAGVVSANPGLLLGEAGPDKVKVAQSGRVKVKVDATYGPITAGDLLVTSATPGHAMRSTPVSIGGALIHQPGTLLGKALEPLKEGQGEILVLLTLQ